MLFWATAMIITKIGKSLCLISCHLYFSPISCLCLCRFDNLSVEFNMIWSSTRNICIEIVIKFWMLTSIRLRFLTIFWPKYEKTNTACAFQFCTVHKLPFFPLYIGKNKCFEWNKHKSKTNYGFAGFQVQLNSKKESGLHCFL